MHLFKQKGTVAILQKSKWIKVYCIDNGPMEGFWGILIRVRYYGRRLSSKW